MLRWQDWRLHDWKLWLLGQMSWCGRMPVPTLTALSHDDHYDGYQEPCEDDRSDADAHRWGMDLQKVESRGVVNLANVLCL